MALRCGRKSGRHGACTAVGGSESLGRRTDRMGTALIVDDDTDLCLLWSFVLESEGHKVTTVSDGIAALGAHDRDRPDVVIADLHLPEVSGLGIISHLRSTRPDARIIAVSGDD